MVANFPKTATRRASAGLAALCVFAACSSKPDVPPMAGSSLGDKTDITSGTTAAQPCDEGSTRACSKTLDRQGSVLTCYYGTQTCSGGIWSDCLDGTTTLLNAPSSSSEKLAALSTWQLCQDNPCDPTCHRYVEVPNSGLMAQASSTTWQTGNRLALPTNIQSLVSKADCQTAKDCQTNQHCINVATGGTCAHNKCVAGQYLQASCDDCVANICATNPSCCSSQQGCGAGQVLSRDGTRCLYFVSTLLNHDAAQANCRTLFGNQWNLMCVRSLTEGAQIAPLTLDNAWLGIMRATLNDPNSAFVCSNGETVVNNGLVQGSRPWNDGEPNYYQGQNENCVELYEDTNIWNDVSCDETFASWCEGPTSAAGAWTNTCSSLVGSVCGATCNTTDTPAPPAQCVAWAPGESNSNDLGPDLSLDVPCNGQIPVCNHGTQVAPAGAIVHVLPTSTPFGTALPPSTTNQLGSCTTSTQISPGTCIMLTGCESWLTSTTADAELWVGYNGTSPESRLDDNWGYYASKASSTTCGPPVCLPGSGACFSSTTRTFDYDGICASGLVPQWSYLTFDATTPGDSSIVFSVAAAPTPDLLAAEPMVTIATVTRAGGNENCSLSGPASKGCPVDLYQALLPSATTHSANLKLTITLIPTSDGTQSPVLSNWNISYSCPAGT